MEITQQQNDAAGEIFELIANELGRNRAVHAATAIAACARLAGSFLFRSFNPAIKNIVPGNVVLSETANEKGPVLISVLSWALRNLQVNLDKQKLDESRNAKPNLEFLETLRLLQNKAAAIMEKQQLDFEHMAYSCSLATAFLIKECEKDMAPEAGFQTAVYSFIEGTKTCPPEFSDTATKKKSFFSFWKRS